MGTGFGELQCAGYAASEHLRSVALVDGRSGEKEAAKLCWAGENILKLSLSISLFLSYCLTLPWRKSMELKIAGSSPNASLRVKLPGQFYE